MIDLLIENYNSLKELNLSNWMDLVIHGCALKYTLKGEKINLKLVNNSMKIIRENTSIFSDFRFKSLVYTALILSFQKNPQLSFNEILKIHKTLKENKFCSGDNLALTSSIIFENKYKIDTYECINKMVNIYKNLIQNHPFTIGENEYITTSLISINSNDIEESLKNMEKSYNYLIKNGINNKSILNLSYMFSFDYNRKHIDDFLNIKSKLEKDKLKINEIGYPLIGVMSILDITDINDFKIEIKYISDLLSTYQGYGAYILDKNYRDLISIAIVLSKYIDDIEINSIIRDKIMLNINKSMDVAINSFVMKSMDLYSSSI